jgi:hypothetical protein
LSRVFSIETLLKREEFNFTFFILTILLNVVRGVNVFRPKMPTKDHWQHIDHAKSHHTALSLQKNEGARFIKLAQLPCSLDLEPCGSFLFDS